MTRIIGSICVLMLLFGCNSKPVQPAKDEATMKQDEKMEWWREARFGMFIHWGLYAVPAGEWKGKEIPGISEWIMLRAEIPERSTKTSLGNLTR